jgi:hypothetical protein
MEVTIYPKRSRRNEMGIFEEIVRKTDYSLIPGLMLEIKDFLNSNELVENFDIYTSEKRYIIHIQLKNYALPNVKRVFSSLLEFIQYESVFYDRKKSNSNGIMFELLSFNVYESYFCEIEFS